MNQTILLLDDDVPLRDMMEMILKKKGYEVIAVSRGDQALSLVEKLDFDLMIIDGLLPDTTGFDFISQLRHSGNTTPTIMLTGHSFFWEDKMTKNILTNGMGVKVLSKPIGSEALLNSVTEMILLKISS